MAFHQGYAPSPLLIVVVMEEAMRLEILLKGLLYVDDRVKTAEGKELSHQHHKALLDQGQVEKEVRGLLDFTNI